MPDKKIFFVIAAFNEEEGIEDRLHSIASIMKNDFFLKSGFNYKIIVVSDGSTDRTVAILEGLKTNYPVIVYPEPINRGPGAAFRVGLKALENMVMDNDIVVTLDGDNTHNVKTIQFMVSQIENGYELVAASGWADGGRLIGLPFSRLMLTKVCNFIYSFLFPIRGITNYTGFFKAFKGHVLKEAFSNYGDQFITCDGFAFMSEIMVKLRRMPVFCSEVPLLIRFDQRKGISKNRIKNTIAEHLYILRTNLFKRKVF